MSRQSDALRALPGPAQEALLRLGQRLRAHRMERRWTIADISSRLLCSPTTWRAMEAGRPGTSVGLMVHALWLLGQADTLDAVAPAPPVVAGGRRVRRPAGQPVPGTITEAERDF